MRARQRLIGSCIALFIPCLLTAQTAVIEQRQAGEQRISLASHPVLFADEIRAYLNQDKINPPPLGGILFIGSSIFRQWENLKTQMAPLPAFNRAFGGARTWEVLHYMDRIVLPYKPKIIVYYCGSNDVNAGASSREIFECFKQFAVRVAEKLPDTRLFFVSINRAPQKKDRWDIVDDANARIKAYCAITKNRGYIDLNPVLFDRQGKPRLELYQSDLLHFKPLAYEEFSRVIKPVLERAWME